MTTRGSARGAARGRGGDRSDRAAAEARRNRAANRTKGWGRITFTEAASAVDATGKQRMKHRPLTKTDVDTCKALLEKTKAKQHELTSKDRKSLRRRLSSRAADPF